MSRRSLFARLLPASLLALLFVQSPGAIAEPAKFKVCWSIYAGWMLWGQMAEQGIIDKWAKQYGIQIEVEQVPDYVASIEQYTAGDYAACAMTNMDALTIPAAAGVDSTALIVGDFSAGADGILIRGADRDIKDLKGKTILLVENSVSHYLLGRALEWAHLDESEVKIENVSDKDLAQVWRSGRGDALVTWNPILADLRQDGDSTLVFSSHHIPGEILDLLVINSATLAAHPELGKALTGAWFEGMRLMGMPTAAGKAARTQMATAAGTTLEDFELQLKTIRSFYAPRSAYAFASSEKMPLLMQRVAGFADAHKLLGNDGNGLQQLGISFSGNRVLGNPAQIKLRFDPSYMQQAAEARL
ncbi:PhnD/SsuA/transferrin family substrate-binding protein [Pseudomonas sp. R-28-1W-6]|uniref:putative urea ABC transporter substrate-binding protein n=1 Tax=Pseudomonas sp. R-28-1W-6 TaxID=2650101 RepID=UPI001365EBF4|nr:putative urea ABC transporter substrate-binding protein [Pseudomonas sp. R-28-1W-6]MWV13242.1 PhnD/SsuA/transferrin family substrate-binding protein [Pseudomonas sp. R-28-1W-6]